MSSVAMLKFPGTPTLPGKFTSDLLNRNSSAFKKIELDFCSEVSELNTDCKMSFQRSQSLDAGKFEYKCFRWWERKHWEHKQLNTEQEYLQWATKVKSLFQIMDIYCRLMVWCEPPVFVRFTWGAGLMKFGRFKKCTTTLSGRLVKPRVGCVLNFGKYKAQPTRGQANLPHQMES